MPQPGKTYRVPDGTHAGLRTLAIKLSPAAGRVITLGEITTALLRLGEANPDAVLAELSGGPVAPAGEDDQS